MNAWPAFSVPWLSTERGIDPISVILHYRHETFVSGFSVPVCMCTGDRSPNTCSVWTRCKCSAKQTPQTEPVVMCLFALGWFRAAFQVLLTPAFWFMVNLQQFQNSAMWFLGETLFEHHCLTAITYYKADKDWSGLPDCGFLFKWWGSLEECSCGGQELISICWVLY